MTRHLLPRRLFLTQIGCAAGAILTGPRPLTRAAEASGRALHLATNQYSWFVFFRREGRDFAASLDAGLAEVAQSGLNGFEPTLGKPDDITALAPLLQKRGLEMRSFYVNSTLHTEEAAERSIADILSIATKAKGVGAQIVVTNPNPIRWGGEESKSDAQLRVQAAALDQLGRKLRALGLSLAYHNHDIELRHAAREFHHMMLGTSPEHVGLCLDAHWIYRGSGNSAVALFDVIKLYSARIKELHLRQSESHVWAETMEGGDIDYERLAAELRTANVKPHLVLEVAVETGTPHTLSAVEAHRRSAAYVRRLFGD